MKNFGDISEIKGKSVNENEKRKENPFDKIEEMEATHQNDVGSSRGISGN